MTTVRFAELADIPALISLARQMHVQSRFAWMVFDSDHLWQYLEQIIPSKRHCLIVAGGANAADGAPLIGLLSAAVQPYAFSKDFMAQIDHLYVLPSERGSPVVMKMMAGLRKWASNREVTEITITNHFGIDERRSAKFLKKLGLSTVGGIYSMWAARK